jgi:hypothetical protein
MLRVTVMVQVFALLKVSMATTVIVFGAPASKGMGTEALPEATTVPSTVIVPLRAPVGVTVMLASSLGTVTPL